MKLHHPAWGLSLRLACVLSVISVVSICGLSAAAEEQDAGYYVYVSLGQENRIVSYRMNPASGQLAKVGGIGLEGAPGAQVVDAQSQHLYVAIRTTGSVTALRIGPKTGELEPIRTSKVAGNPVYLGLDKTGRWLLTAYYGDDQAAVYPIGDDAAVGDAASSIVKTGRNPHSIMADPTGRFVMVPNTGADKVLVYRFDAANGKLEPADPPAVETGEKTGPRHFFFHPSRPWVYFVNERGSSVSAFAMDRESGKLAELQIISTLPDDFTENNSCADIEITPSGKYLYASNRGHDSLACYAIDQASGKLTFIGHAKTEKTPRSFTIDPTGEFVFAGGQGSGRLASYRIDSKSGQLKPLKVYDVGKDPAWVQVVKIPGG